MPRPPGRDRLRELLDAVLDDDATSLAAMARGAHTSPFHLGHRLSSLAGESPVAMRRRVELERAAWRLEQGSSVTDAALVAGYESVEGFSRAFARAYGHPPSTVGAGSGHRLPALNGIHFHPPHGLWVHDRDRPGEQAGRAIGEVTLLMVHQDVDDVAALLVAAAGLDAQVLDAPWCPDPTAPGWGEPARTLLGALRGLVVLPECWTAAIVGADTPPDPPGDGVGALRERYERVAPRWLATVLAIEERRGWGDRVVDAICEPPQSFVLAGVLAHALTFSVHRRQLVRGRLRELGALTTPTTPDTDDADPLNWLDRRSRGAP